MSRGRRTMAGGRGLGALIGRRPEAALREVPADAGRRIAPRPSALTLVPWALLMPLLILVQGSILSFLPVPWAVPDLALLVVLGLAHHRGALAGGLMGAWAGLLMDVLPPATGSFGGWTLVLAAVGWVHGQVVDTRRPGPLLALALMAVSAGAAVAAHALVLWFSGVAVAPDAVLRAVLGSAAWALMLAPVALLCTGGRIRSVGSGPQLAEATLLDAVTPGWATVAPSAPTEATPSRTPARTADGTRRAAP